ncbi:cytoplasmic membrane protein [Sulfurimonas denitrificans DSM 1251]|uniref:Cytoplasmic membrane protein n=1 Tax=Sulfurimonas denitrificans (strain ATCC 33889 / DSM 1251) TaxID=326298 RepID=Q30UL5_SULDN|nr:DedA family protein [Sulfurimonas denitrificans]ABB43316.1 cytoplasmic membrane protein [Sulfurimonas denitrificans DSM 1251]MDD3443353.1 DedA family protein [Sulfurimonas denitrificans]
MAATILPFSSEISFVAALESGMSVKNAMFFASSGNILAIILNYSLGYLLYEKTKTKLLSSKIGRVSYKYGHSYGYVALLFSWLPIIGDPLTLVAGVLRLNFIYFILISASLRVLRYYFLTLML